MADNNIDKLYQVLDAFEKAGKDKKEIKKIRTMIEKGRISDSRSPGCRLGKSDRKSLWLPGGKNHTLCDQKRAGCLGWARKRKAEENGFGASGRV